MRLLLPVRECFGRALEKKIVLIIYAVLFLAGMILGIIFIKSPAFYEYHAGRCESFIEGVCYTERSVFLILLERFAGHALVLVLLLASGIHPVGLVITPVVILFRSYTFGGSIAIFFSVYHVTGALIAIAFYIPVHILFDCIFLAAISLSFQRAFRFKFGKGDFRDLILDLMILLIFTLLVCIVEIILLLLLFHTVGNIL